VGRQIVNVPSFVVRLDSEKVRSFPVPSPPYASLSVLACTFFDGDVHTLTAYRFCAHLTFRWRPCGTRQEEACCSCQQGRRGGRGGVDDVVTFTSPRLSAHPPSDWNPVYGAIDGAVEYYAWKAVCEIIGREMLLCCSMRPDSCDANSCSRTSWWY
jgi:hypothetical protein